VLGDFDSIETALKRSYRRDIVKPVRQPFRLRRKGASSPRR
jgi:thiamine pyrophosphokinase